MDSNWSVTHSHLHGLLKRHRWLPRHGRVLVALSGGQDSVCLTKLLLDLQPHWCWDLAIAHCDHGWSTDDGIADHVAALAAQWDLPCHICDGVHIKETEGAARRWRYEALTTIAYRENFKFIVTGHTQTDRAETVLFNLFRGAGVRGLGVLPVTRALDDHLTLVRPLLHLSRSQTRQFCEQYSLPIWDDQVNENLNYARNRMRREVMPYIKEHFNTQVEAHLSQAGEILQAESAYLEQLATEHYRCLCPEPHCLHRGQAQQLPIALQRRVIIKFMGHHQPKTLTFEQVESLRYLLRAPQRSQSSTLPGGIGVVVTGDFLVIKKL